MMTNASPTKAEEDQETSTYFILDETGDTSFCPSELLYDRPEPKKDEVRGDEPGISEEVDGGEEGFETVDDILNQSNSSDGSPMRTRLVLRSSIGQTPPGSSRGCRRRNKRKRLQSMTTPGVPKRTKPSPKTPVKAKKKRNKKKKSVIVVGDSDSEHETSPCLPDLSVVEIDDDNDSVIVLSDDEIGVCSGSLSTTKKPLQPINTINKPPPEATTKTQSLTNPLNTAKPQATTNKPASLFNPKKRRIPHVDDLTGEPPEKNYFELYNPQDGKGEKKTGLRPIIIDGSNVAFGHGRDRFSSLGLKICVDYFKKMGHEVRVFVPQFRKTHVGTADPQILEALEKDGTLSFTPSRRTDGKMIVSYDDRFIVQYADATGGIIVSRDNYRDLVNENPEYKDTIHKRLLMFTWVGDTIMFPKDPLGRGGPNLQQFLKF